MLLECALSWLEAGKNVRVGLLGMQAALSPEFRDSKTDPGLGKMFTIRSGFLVKHELVQTHGLWAKAVEVIQAVEIADWQPIKEVIEDWSYPGRVQSHTYELDDMMRDTAGRMLRDMVRLAENRPGVLQWAREIAEAIDLSNLEIPIDETFEILHPALSDGDFRSAEAVQRSSVLELATTWSRREAEDVAEQIVRIEFEAQAAGHNWPNWTPVFCEEIAEVVDSPLVWARALNGWEGPGEAISICAPCCWNG